MRRPVTDANQTMLRMLPHLCLYQNLSAYLPVIHQLSATSVASNNDNNNNKARN